MRLRGGRALPAPHRGARDRSRRQHRTNQSDLFFFFLFSLFGNLFFSRWFLFCFENHTFLGKFGWFWSKNRAGSSIGWYSSGDVYQDTGFVKTFETTLPIPHTYSKKALSGCSHILFPASISLLSLCVKTLSHFRSILGLLGCLLE